MKYFFFFLFLILCSSCAFGVISDGGSYRVDFVVQPVVSHNESGLKIETIFNPFREAGQYLQGLYYAIPYVDAGNGVSGYSTYGGVPLSFDVDCTNRVLAGTNVSCTLTAETRKDFKGDVLFTCYIDDGISRVDLLAKNMTGSIEDSLDLGVPAYFPLGSEHSVNCSAKYYDKTAEEYRAYDVFDIGSKPFSVWNLRNIRIWSCWFWFFLILFLLLLAVLVWWVVRKIRQRRMVS